MADRKVREPELSPREAVAQYERAAKENRNDAQSELNLGSAYYIAGDLDAALAAFSSALSISPGLDHAHYYRGVIYTKRGDKTKAREEFEKIVNGSGHAMLKDQARIQLQAL